MHSKQIFKPLIQVCAYSINIFLDQLSKDIHEINPAISIDGDKTAFKKVDLSQQFFNFIFDYLL